MNRMPEISAGHHNLIQQPLNDAQMLAAWLLSIKGAHNRMSIVSRLVGGIVRVATLAVLSRLCSALAADPKMGYYGVTGERSTARPVHLHTSLAVYPATPAGSFLSTTQRNLHP